MVERSQVIVELLTGVKKVDLRVRPDPGTLLIGLIMPYGRAQNHDVLKEPPVGPSSRSKMKTVLPHPVCPHIVAEWAVCGKRLISRLDEPAIFNIELRIHDDKKMDVQSAGRLCLLRDLDRNAFAGIFYAAAVAMKAVIIACPEVKPQ